MTRFVLGPSGSGKTTYLTERILSDLKDGKRVILLVPEQAAVRAEAQLCREAQTRRIRQDRLEILNFRRLCNRIFREYGGISYHSISSGAKAMLLWEALFTSAPHLKQLGRELEDARHFIPTLRAAVEECKAYGVLPRTLGDIAAEAAEEQPRLADKLYDLSLLYAVYDELLHQRWEDPSEDLTRAAELLSRSPFFEDTSLYLDAFKGFTPEQYRVLSYAFRQADDVTVTLTLRDSSESLAFGSLWEEYKKLRSLCVDATPEVLTLDQTHRFSNAVLSALEEHLWQIGEAPADPAPTEAVRTVYPTNAYEEAEFVAADMMKRLRDGARYSDFAVIARDIHSYDGILDSIFAKYHLPQRISRHQELSEVPLFKLVLSAFHIRASDWALPDVIGYLKTGLLPLSADEGNALETYADRWNLHSRQWTADEDWYMNPDGYTDTLTEEGRALLTLVNRLRREIVFPLRKLHESLDGSKTIKEICQAVLAFLEELSVPDRLAADGRDDDVRLWNCFCDALDTMVDTLPDRTADAKQFLTLFSLVVAESSIGTLPAASDEIVVGSAGQIRAEGVKHTYLLGVNESVFPASGNAGGFFSDDEKALLEGYGVNLSPAADRRAEEELYIFYTAATTASDSLTLLCPRASLDGEELHPSVAAERVRVLFPNHKQIDPATLSGEERLQHKEAAFEYAFLLNDDCGEALRRYYRADPSYAAFFAADRQPLVVDKEALSEASAEALFRGDLSLTQSRLDRYVLCPFSYHCTYLLKLKESKRAEFRPSDIGNLVHRILEKFFASVLIDGRIPAMPDEEVRKRVDELLDEYLFAIFGQGSKEISSRSKQLFLRLRRTVLLLLKNLLEEFSQSEFVPTFFELPIQTGDAPNTVSPLAIPLPDGTHAYIYGIADRVDICRQGEDVYVRVVDYKTGHKTFSMADITLGLNLQMLLYLFSIWRDEGGKFRRAVGCHGKILPAGVLYFEANPGTVSAPAAATEAQIYEIASDQLGRNGLLLNDEEILRLMEKKLSGRYLPVTLSKSGALSVRGSSLTLASLEEMGQLMTAITDTVSKIATEIKSGNADCTPLRTPKHDACRYCPHKSVCRSPKAFEAII